MDTSLKALESDRDEQLRQTLRKEFKQEAVRLLMTSGKTSAELGRELGVTGMTLGTWKEEAIRNGDHPEEAKPDGLRIHYSVLKLENARLKKELETVRQEREILKNP